VGGRKPLRKIRRVC